MFYIMIMASIDKSKGCDKGLSFIQCNLQKAREGQWEMNGKISKLNKQEKHFFCLVQEPYAGKNSLVMQPNSCKKFMVGKLPRTAIYADNKTNCWLVESLSSRDLVVVHTVIMNQEVLIVSSYLDIAYDEVITNELIKAIEYAEEKDWGLLIGMDSNCHSITYGLETNKRGEKLEVFLADTGLIIENIGKEPTYESRGRSTRIDITLSKNLRQAVLDWRVDREYNGSDHNTILFDVRQDIINLPRTWNWKKADWDVYENKLRKYKSTLPKNIKDEDCEFELINLYKEINGAMKVAIPKAKPITIDKNNPWWSKFLKNKRNSVSKLYKAQIKDPTNSKINKYKEAHREYKSLCEKARKKSWRMLQDNINSIQDMNNFRKIIDSSNKITLGTLVKDDGSITDPGAETVDYLLQKHFHDAIPLKPTQYSKRTVSRDIIVNWEPEWITAEKLVAVFDGFKNKKSPGTDGINPIVLKHLPKAVIDAFILLYKCLILLHFTPTRWKESKVVFIPKPGKESYKVHKAWRGISLTNYPLKALEKLCCWHMDEMIAVTPLHKQQHGFRSDRNTETALSNVVNYIESFINFQDKRSTVLAVFLDIQAAFDTIKPDKILKELLKYGAHTDMAHWYYNYITHRNMYVTINGITRSITTSTGFPQGGVCSAKFWIIAFNEAIEIINTRGVYGVGFADDCVALLGGTNIHQQMSRMQKVVTTLEEWGDEHGLTFNALKTEVIIFSKSTEKKVEYPNKLVVGNERIEFSKRAKYLGMYVDSRLNWTYHIEKKIEKAKQTLFMLRNATSKKWGPKPTYMKWMFNAVVKSRITYGSIVSGFSLRTKRVGTMVNKVNHLAVSMIANTRRTTPRLALELIYDLPPLDLVLKYEGLASLARNKDVMIDNVQKTRKIKGHLNFWLDQASMLGISIDETDAFKGDMWNKKYSVNKDSFLYTGAPVFSQVTIFTDGSKTDEHVGSGYVIYTKGREISSQSIRLDDEITVYQAEVIAIKAAAEFLKTSKDIDYKYVKIFCDSQAALMALDKWKVKSKTVMETMIALNELGETCQRLELCWVKAHNNYFGNERADELARNAVYENVILFSVPPPHSFFKLSLWEAIYEDWKTRWQNEPTCRMTKLFYPGPHKRKAKTVTKLSRNKSRRLIEIVTGQNNLNYIQNKVKNMELLCRFCEEEEETFDHLITECPCFRKQQWEFDKGQTWIGTHNWTIDGIIKFSKISGIDRALKQLNDSSDEE